MTEWEIGIAVEGELTDLVNKIDEADWIDEVQHIQDASSIRLANRKTGKPTKTKTATCTRERGR